MGGKDPTARPVPDDEIEIATNLINTIRWAALSTIDDEGNPMGAMVAYVPSPNLECLLIHVSRLSLHTRNLLARPSAGLTIGEPDNGEGDPQLLARLSLQGMVSVLQRDTPEYLAAKIRYLEHLPDAEQLFGFSDFVMFRFVPQTVHYVGGFARAYRFSAETLQR